MKKHFNGTILWLKNTANIDKTLQWYYFVVFYHYQYNTVIDETIKTKKNMHTLLMVCVGMEIPKWIRCCSYIKLKNPLKCGLPGGSCLCEYGCLLTTIQYSHILVHSFSRNSYDLGYFKMGQNPCMKRSVKIDEKSLNLKTNFPQKRLNLSTY